MATTPPAPGEIRQLLVHPAVWNSLELWLAACGIEITEVGVIGDDNLRTYATTPTTLRRPAPDAGPTVREAAADDRRWPLQKHGE